jgi:hypothetical protein
MNNLKHRQNWTGVSMTWRVVRFLGADCGPESAIQASSRQSENITKNIARQWYHSGIAGAIAFWSGEIQTPMIVGSIKPATEATFLTIPIVSSHLHRSN